MKLWSLVATSETFYRQAHFLEFERSFARLPQAFCPILYGQKEQTPDWKQVFNPLFCKWKSFQEPIASSGRPQKWSSGWFLTEKLVPVYTGALSCGSLRNIFCLYRFLYLLWSVTGVSPPYPHHLLKKVDKNSDLPSAQIWREPEKGCS